MLKQQMETLAQKLFKQELGKLNYKHMDRVEQIATNYVTAMYEGNYVEEQGVNILNFMEGHIVHRAQAEKEMENDPPLLETEMEDW